MLFKKINLVLPDIDLDRIKGDPLEAYGSEFFSWTIKDTEYLDQLLENRIRFGILPYKVTYDEMPNGTVPHSHSQDTATFNYYIHSNGAPTRFFQTRSGQNGTPSPRVMPNGALSNHSTITQYKLTEIKFIDKFIPESGDAYFFESQKIHAVARINAASTRKILRFAWDTVPYEEIVNSIEILSPA